MGGVERKPFSNCYVFAKVMRDNVGLAAEVARLAVGRALPDAEVVEVESGEAAVSSRGVRFDVYLRARGTLIALEMQAGPEPRLALRERYYHAWPARHVLPKGAGLQGLPDAYVVFVLRSGPASLPAPAYELGRHLYPRDGGEVVPFGNGARTVVLNASGDLSRASPGLAELLQYVRSGSPAGPGSLTARLEEAVGRAYEDEGWVRSMGIMEVTEATRERDIEDRALSRGMSVGMAEGRSRGMAEGISQGISRGATAERAREAALLEAMQTRGLGAAEILSAIAGGDRDALYREYGIE